jgi:phosphoglycerate dehydrogenase-like enzyme
MSGIPKFGKNWLDNFIPDEEMQNTFMTSEVVRNVLMLQCIFYASVYNELVLYKHTYINQKVPDQNQISMADLPAGLELPEFKVGILGCGQVGTVLLTKLLEVKDQFHNLKMIVSTRQPHLLRPFQQEFGVECVFDNQKVAAESDIIFVCVLPS